MLLLSEVLSLQALAQVSTGAYLGVATGSEATTAGSGVGQNYLTLGTMTARTAPAVPTVGAVTIPSTMGTTEVAAIRR